MLCLLEQSIFFFTESDQLGQVQSLTVDAVALVVITLNRLASQRYLSISLEYSNFATTARLKLCHQLKKPSAGKENAGRPVTPSSSVFATRRYVQESRLRPGRLNARQPSRESLHANANSKDSKS